MGLVKSMILNTGINLPESYSYINKITQNLFKKIIEIEVILFKDKDAFLTKKEDLGISHFSVKNEIYNTYFDETVLKQNNVSLYTQTELYLLSLPVYNDATIS